MSRCRKFTTSRREAQLSQQMPARSTGRLAEVRLIRALRSPVRRSPEQPASASLVRPMRRSQELGFATPRQISNARKCSSDRSARPRWPLVVEVSAGRVQHRTSELVADLCRPSGARSALEETLGCPYSAEKSLEDLRTAQDRLVQTEKLASLGQLTAGIAHEIKNPLNFVNNFSAISVELIDELREALAGANLDNNLRARSTRSQICCRAISTRSCSTASVPTRSSRTCCCIRVRAR